MTGISNIRKHRNISLVTRVLRRYELFTTSKKSLCVGIACEINFCLQQKQRGFLLPRLLKSKNAHNLSFSTNEKKKFIV